eukprot:8700168-Heterocapsa_arctica.AAC.1
MGGPPEGTGGGGGGRRREASLGRAGRKAAKLGPRGRAHAGGGGDPLGCGRRIPSVPIRLAANG